VTAKKTKVTDQKTKGTKGKNGQWASGWGSGWGTPTTKGTPTAVIPTGTPIATGATTTGAATPSTTTNAPSLTPSSTSITPSITPSSTSVPLSCPLQTAGNFAVLGSTTVTNTGPTTLNSGNLGLSPGTSITGQAEITLTGGATTNIADAVAAQAQADLTTAFNALSSAACGSTPAAELGGQTFTPGVYCLSSSAQITGDLTLDGGGQYIFQIPSTLTTANAARILLQNGASACNIFFLVGSSATLGGSNTFNGNILAQTSISSVGSDTVNGSLLASTGAVTLDSDTISSPSCGCP
jgi:hypothetical protein